MSANTRLDSLHDLIKHKANLRVTCRCGNVHIYDTQRLCRYAMCRSWNTRRGPALRAVPDPPTPTDTFPRSEDEWKRLVRRLRG